MKKDIFREYINSMNKGCPDMDKLWQKISDHAGDTENADSADISPFEKAMKDCRQPSPISPIKTAAAAAAVLVIAAAVRGAGDHEISVNEHTPAENPDNAAMEEQVTNTVVSVASWDYETHCDFAESYNTLDLNSTYDDPFTGLTLPEDEPEYFVEENVLDETDGFIDCRVISSEKVSQTAVRYLVEVVHFVGEEGDTIDRKTSVVSHSPYALRAGREYLLPINRESGEPALAFDNAPQIEITADRQVVCHNGWSSLTENSGLIEYPQVSPDDFFYDRMNVTAESSLDELFDKWRKISE